MANKKLPVKYTGIIVVFDYLRLLDIIDCLKIHDIFFYWEKSVCEYGPCYELYVENFYIVKSLIENDINKWIKDFENIKQQYLEGVIISD